MKDSEKLARLSKHARAPKGVRLVTGDRVRRTGGGCERIAAGARQRCMVHFERNILAKVNPKNRELGRDALKAIFSMESRTRRWRRRDPSPRTWRRGN